MRNRYKKNKYYPHAVEGIGRNYGHLYTLCCNGKHGYFDSRSYDDIFQDTVIFVSQDKHASTLSSDKELIDYFCYRFRMIEFQTIQDNKQLKEIPYADHLQAQKATEEE